MSNIIDSIRMSGTTYAISDSGGTKVVEITQSDYDNLPTSAKTANIMYVITDAEPFDVSNYYTKAETSGATELATAFAATQPKLSAGTNITIDANNVISASGGGGGIDSGTVQTMIDQSISGKTNQTDFVSHSGNTTMHVTASEKSTWNNKSDFSGNYNDLSNKPTIPTSASQLTNDSGYITSSALDGYATEAYVTAATNDMATKTWVGQQGYLTQHQDISGKQDVSGMTAYTTTATTNTLSGTVTAHTANTTVHVTAKDKTNWNNKSDFSGDYNDLTNKPTIPTVPTNVSDFTNDAGYATSGYVQSVTSDMATKTWVGNQGYLTQHQDISGKLDVSVFESYSGTVNTELSNKLDTTAYTPVVIDSSLNTSSNNAVANSAITNNTLSGGVESNNYFRSVRFRKNNGEVAFYKRFAAINGNSVMVDGTTEAPNFSLVGTSAITTSVTSASTDVQVPSAKAVYDALQEGGGGNSVVELTQSEYDALVTGGTVDPNTFYVITDAQEIDTDDYYTKSQTSGATELATAFGAKLDATAYTPTDLSNYYTKSETSGSSEISTALATKLNVSDFNTYSGTVNTSLSSKASQNDLDTLSGQVSTNTSNISTVSASTASNTTALGGLSLVKLTQSAYDALTTKDPNTLYVIVN